MNNIIVGMIAASTAAGVTFIFTRRYYNKKLDHLANATTEEVRSMHEQLKEVHRIFVEDQPIEVASSRQKTWDAIANSVKSNAGKTDEEVVQEFRSGIENAKKNKEEGSDILRAYSPVQKDEVVVNEEIVPDTITNDPDIFLITELEFHDMDTRRTKGELHLWMVEEGLYDDADEPLDACKGFIGMTLEELMDFVDAHADTDYLYFRNEKTKADYSVIVHRAGYSAYFQSVSNS